MNGESPWICGTCGRGFSKENQSHSCQLVPIDSHFEKRDPSDRELLDALVGRIEVAAGPVRVESLKSCLHLASRSAFAGVHFPKSCLRLEFSMNRNLNSARFRQVDQLSKERFHHKLELESPSHLDDELVGWLAESYRLHS